MNLKIHRVSGHHRPRYMRNSLTAIEASVGGCSHYLSSLLHAFDAAEPIFIHPDYEKFFWTCTTTVPGWVQSVILQSAISESDGSTSLFKMWQAITYNKEVEDGLLAHAKDEARHSRVFFHLVKNVFPAFIPEDKANKIFSHLIEFKDGCFEKSGLALPENITIDYLVQINLSEVRTLMNLHLIAPILYSLASEDKKEYVEMQLKSLQHDELRHISYTARLMEGWASSGDDKLVTELFLRNMSEFNEYTVRGTEKAIEAYGQGKFPTLLRL
ncbi:hypothetical protein [Methylocystis sp. SB2]|uniref:hypothetical protein n=1 Tax=Methylocystis sp. (strain SB2) TaxID=743836 RepID=UPI001EFAAB28|nr:hypothetical protein [Methylocystis sp. SB2]ULO24733.1 hypothetical protein LNB28_04865 [Methylocystis sp. SB2]